MTGFLSNFPGNSSRTPDETGMKDLDLGNTRRHFQASECVESLVFEKVTNLLT